MSPLVMVVVVSTLAGDGTAIGLDDGTIWLVHDGDADEIGACDDGEVIAMSSDDVALSVACGDGTAWTWSDEQGWREVTSSERIRLTATTQRSFWPALDLVIDRRPRDPAAPVWEAWVDLRWNL